MNTAQIMESPAERKFVILTISPDEELRNMIKEKLAMTSVGFGDMLEKDSLESAFQEEDMASRADVIFADISPSPESILRKLRLSKPLFKRDVIIVILSDQAQLYHAVESLHLGAFDFIHLPFDEKRWSDFQDRLSSTLAKSTPTAFMPITQTILKPGGKQGQLLVRLLKREVRLVALESIVYVEANGAVSYIYLADGERIVSSSQLAHFTELTESKQNMIRVHRKFLVNIDHIQSYNTKNGCIQFRVDLEPIYSSRRMGAQLKKKLINPNNT